MKRKLLFLIRSMSMGGAERVTANLANYWVQMGWQVAVATLTSAESDFYALDTRVERIPLGMATSSPHLLAAVSKNLCAMHKVRRLLKEWQPEVAVGMMTASSVYLALSGRNLPVRCIGSVRNHPPDSSLGGVWGHLQAFSYGWLDAVVALTALSAERIRTHTRARSVVVIGNPIHWPLPSQDPIRDPAEVMRSGRRFCLAVGRLVEQKGFDLLLNAFAGIADKFPEWDLIIAGEGKLRADLERLIRELGLLKRVHLVGRVGNMSDWYSMADLYVMSSRSEGFGNTLTEAMAYGLPVISFACDAGPPDIVRNEIDGLLVPGNDVPALNRGLERLMKDRGLRYRLSARAIEARQRFSLKRIAKMWEEEFQRVCIEK